MNGRWEEICSYDSLKEGLDFIKNEVGFNSTRTTKRQNCSFDCRAKMHVQIRYCNNPKCVEKYDG